MNCQSVSLVAGFLESARRYPNGNALWVDEQAYSYAELLHRAARIAATLQREGEGEKLICLFNLGKEEARFAVPAGLDVGTLAGHGFSGTLEADGRSIALPAGDGFFGTLA